MKNKKKLTILVSSTVHGIEELLERVYTLLTNEDYEVWMSHKGTLPVFSKHSAYENCIQAVEKCDLFLGIITTNYGSGIQENGLSITHNELLKAIEINKPRWLLSHDHVVYARKLLEDLGYNGKNGRKKLSLKNSASSLEDMRVLDMYEEAALKHKDANVIKGNWVQKFISNMDALLFTSAQFSRYQEVEEFIKENFSNLEQIRAITSIKKGGKA
ncbi:DUF4062 domain-containing protein [bacterium]|nr:DUF4062 domain-containing protein [bacterium]